MGSSIKSLIAELTGNDGIACIKTHQQIVFYIKRFLDAVSEPSQI